MTGVAGFGPQQQVQLRQRLHRLVRPVQHQRVLVAGGVEGRRELHAAGEQGFCVARAVGLMAGLPIAAGGATINRLCGSSLQAINQAAHAIVYPGKRLVFQYTTTSTSLQKKLGVA